MERKQEFGALTAMVVIQGVELDMHDRLTAIEVAYIYGRGYQRRAIHVTSAAGLEARQIGT